MENENPTNDNIITMGGIPVGSTTWPEFEQHKQTIIDICLREEKPNVIESGVAPSIKTNLWESNFDFLTKHKELQELNTWLNVSVNRFVNYVNRRDHKMTITESWAHVTRPNGYHGPHRHPGSTWSGIFFVDADYTEDSGTTLFNHFNMPRYPGYEFFEEHTEINFNPGSLVIFPSTMMHYAKPYLGKDRRIVIAFNSLVFRQFQP
jgi:uncharacterized protein (TIGR02466 family)